MEIQGSQNGSGCRFAIVVAQFNDTITAGLLQGAKSVLADASVSPDHITVVRVPGAFEIPLTAMRLAETGRFDAIVCLGCLIKGDTMHFEYISSAVSSGIMEVSIATGVPTTFGVLTTLTEEQAEARAAANAENKGGEAAAAAIQMVTLLRQVAEDEAPEAAGKPER